MKKIILFSLMLFGLALACLFLTSCAEKNLPPEPGAPGTTAGGALAGQAVEGAEQYAEPTTFTLTPELLEIEEGGAGEIVASVAGETYVYKTCHYYVPNEGWVPFELEGANPVGNWFAGSASKLEEISTGEIPPGENLVVCYACSWDDAIDDWNCHSDKWMLNQFALAIVPPLCAADADCGAGLACNPLGKCVECTESSHCSAGFKCEAETCVELECLSSADCASGQYCSSFNECLAIGLPDEPTAPQTIEVGGEVPVEAPQELPDCYDSDVNANPYYTAGYVEYIGEPLFATLGSSEAISDGRYKSHDSCYSSIALRELECKSPYQNRYWMVRLVNCPEGLACLENVNGAYCG